MHIGVRPPNDSTHSFANLRSHLKHNRIAQLPSHIFREQHRLRKLFLDHNRIRVIPPGVFRHLHALEWLMLGDNLLDTFPLGELQHLTALRTLNLSANMLTLQERHDGIGAHFPELPAIMEM